MAVLLSMSVIAQKLFQRRVGAQSLDNHKRNQRRQSTKKSFTVAARPPGRPWLAP